MEQYTFLREMADSWMVLALFIFLIGVFLWVLRPGATQQYRDTANIPFRHSDKPVMTQTQDIPDASKEAGK